MIFSLIFEKFGKFLNIFFGIFPKLSEISLLSEIDRNFTEISRNFAKLAETDRNLPKLTEISRNRFRVSVQTLITGSCKNSNTVRVKMSSTYIILKMSIA